MIVLTLEKALGEFSAGLPVLATTEHGTYTFSVVGVEDGLTGPVLRLRLEEVKTDG